MIVKFNGQEDFLTITTVLKTSDNRIGFDAQTENNTGFIIYADERCVNILHDYRILQGVEITHTEEYTFFKLPDIEENTTPIVHGDLGTQIEVLKAELASTDYRIIKLYEYSLVGIEVDEYDINALHVEREAKRQQINELEAQLLSYTPL